MDSKTLHVLEFPKILTRLAETSEARMPSASRWTWRRTAA
jgi:hypothetical protein